MGIRKVSFLVCSLLLFYGCGSFLTEADKDAVGVSKNKATSKTVTADVLAGYYELWEDSESAYFTKQRHTYNVNSLKMTASADEPSGSYKISGGLNQLSIDGSAGQRYWSEQMAGLLAVSFSITGGWQSPEGLDFEKQQQTQRVQGILYDVYFKLHSGKKIKLFSRVSDGEIERLEISSDSGCYSAFCYNRFYEAALDRVVAHNIDIYRGEAGGIDAKLIYSAEFTEF